MVKLVYLLGAVFPSVRAFHHFEPEHLLEPPDLSGLAEITRALQVHTLAILVLSKRLSQLADCFFQEIHSINQQSIVFNNRDDYFDYITARQEQSFATTSLIFGRSKDVIIEIQNRELGHRLNLYLFFWNSTRLPKFNFYVGEPIKIVLLTGPRPRVIRVFYNQARPDGQGRFTLVNWYDGDSLGLFRTPLLPGARDVYNNFQRRILKIPAFHSPPWHFVDYHNETFPENDTSSAYNDTTTTTPSDFMMVKGGRDDNLLKLLAKKLNFRYEYIDPPERAQGSASISLDNMTMNAFTGGIGMLQRREADLFLGDIAISLERSTVVEFSFFTLADSGTFVTHAPQRLNEALILIRPFHVSVWPPLLVTVLLSGPIIYVFICLPNRWRKVVPNPQNFYLVNIAEMGYGLNWRRLDRPAHGAQLPDNLLRRCMWFAFKLFLRQSCHFDYGGTRVRIIIAMFWIAATYILGDVYSAQLTSQLARPARESPIDTLYKLEHAMRYEGYQLYVENQSASLTLLENGTEIFHRLHVMMLGQTPKANNNSPYLIDSVEQGLEYILHSGSRKAVLGGRETLYFNMRRYGVKNFQMSEKLYTRYSAVAVQNGCPFLDSLNLVLIHLFESGVLDRMTNEEYEKMFQDSQTEGEKGAATLKGAAEDQPALKMLSLRTLKGAFFLLFSGYILSFVVLLLEMFAVTRPLWCDWGQAERLDRILRQWTCIWCQRLLEVCRRSILFRYKWE